MYLWRKIRAWLDFGMGQRMTRMGLVFIVAVILIALAAFSSANNLLFLILAAMLATFMISGFISRLSLAGLALEFLVPEHMCAGRKLPARIVVRNEKRWMPSFSIHLAAAGDNGLTAPLYFPVVPGGARLEQAVELYFARRGSYRENRFRFSTSSPFGFVERRTNVFLRRELLIYPSIDPQPGFENLLLELNGEIESLFRGLGTDFYLIRPYEAFESVRHVDWKATAHTGGLQVREFAREQDRALSFFLDLDIDRDHYDWFERAIDCSAYLAWHMAQRGARIRFCTQEIDLDAAGESNIYAILRYLASVSPACGKALPVPGDHDSFQIVFSPHPLRLAESGWNLSSDRARVLGPADLPRVPVGPNAG